MIDYPLIGVVRHHEGNTSSPVPAYRKHWSRLRQLRWHAEIAELDAGLPPGTIRVHKGRSWTNGRFDYGLFSLSMPNIGLSAGDFHSTWQLITGIGIGASLRDTAPFAQNDAPERPKTVPSVIHASDTPKPSERR